jgi:hypothetical protein
VRGFTDADRGYGYGRRGANSRGCPMNSLYLEFFGVLMFGALVWALAVAGILSLV